MSRPSGVAWLLILTFGWVGCTDGGSSSMRLSSPFTDEEGAPRHGGSRMQPISEHTPVAGATYMRLVRLQIIPVTVPAGSISGSERLWRYLDEEIGEVAMLATLKPLPFPAGRCPCS